MQYYFNFNIYKNKVTTPQNEVIYEDFAEVEVTAEDLASAKNTVVKILGDKYTDYKFILKRVIVKTDKN